VRGNVKGTRVKLTIFQFGIALEGNLEVKVVVEVRRVVQDFNVDNVDQGHDDLRNREEKKGKKRVARANAIVFRWSEKTGFCGV
jgi:hypothetical protein